jgi:hypothetical protein
MIVVERLKQRGGSTGGFGSSDLIELTVLLAALLQFRTVLGRESSPLAAVDLGLGHPGPGALVPDPELSDDLADNSVALLGLGDDLKTIRTARSFISGG